MTALLYADRTYYLRGVGYRIHKQLRGGHAELDYENALVTALEQDSVAFLRQPLYQVEYRNQQIGKYYPDLVLEDGMLQLDLKATPQIIPLHKAQMLSYLAVTQANLGLIMNFGSTEMQYERLPNFLHERVRQFEPPPASADLLFPALTGQVLDALFAVHWTLGPGFLHQIYRRAARIELAHRTINFIYLKELPLRYNGQVIAIKPTRLLNVDGKLLVATLALQQITPTHTEKLRWTMNETGCQLGIIANFYPSRLEIRFLRNP